MLQVQGLSSGYGSLPILHGLGMEVHEGEVVAVVGANGAGKTTFLRTLTGLVPATAGTVQFEGEDITAVPAHQRPGRGVVMVPEGRRLFPFMTVQENLLLGAHNPRAKEGAAQRLTEVFDLFPTLRERRAQLAGSMSGGEQQMCALGRAVMARPSLLLLDEPSLGLAPIMVEKILDMVRRLSESGLTMLLIEQNVHDALDIADRGYVMADGAIIMQGTGAELLAREDLQRTYMGA